VRSLEVVRAGRYSAITRLTSDNVPRLVRLCGNEAFRPTREPHATRRPQPS
jgi:hypothetical protein